MNDPAYCHLSTDTQRLSPYPQVLQFDTQLHALPIGLEEAMTCRLDADVAACLLALVEPQQAGAGGGKDSQRRQAQQELMPSPSSPSGTDGGGGGGLGESSSVLPMRGGVLSSALALSLSDRRERSVRYSGSCGGGRAGEEEMGPVDNISLQLAKAGTCGGGLPDRSTSGPASGSLSASAPPLEHSHSPRARRAATQSSCNGSPSPSRGLTTDLLKDSVTQELLKDACSNWYFNTFELQVCMALLAWGRTAGLLGWVAT